MWFMGPPKLWTLGVTGTNSSVVATDTAVLNDPVARVYNLAYAIPTSQGTLKPELLQHRINKPSRRVET
jgi:hypothetical protein